MLRRQLFLLAISLVFGPLVLGIHSVEAASLSSQKYFNTKFAGRNITLVIPAGYCVIPRDTAQGKPIYDLQEVPGYLPVGVMFSDCAEWKLYESGAVSKINRRGDYRFLLSKDGKPLVLTKSRDSFLKEASRGLKPLGDRGADLEKAANETISKSKISTGKLASLELSVVGQDSIAVYMIGTTLIKYPNEKSSRAIAMSVGVTLVNGVPVQLNMYDAYKNEKVLVVLVNDVKSTLREVIMTNPD